MAAAGTAKGLGGVLQKDYSTFEALERDHYYRDGERKKKQKAKDDFANKADFKVDYSSVLPMYAKEMTNLQAGFINKMAELKQSDSPNAETQMWREYNTTKARLEQLQYNNDKGVAYLEQDPKDYHVDQDISRLLTSQDSSIGDLEKINDGYYFQTDAMGGFNAMPIARADRKPYVTWDDKDRDVKKLTGRTGKSPIEGYVSAQEEWYVSDDVVNQRIASSMEDPVLAQEQLYTIFRETGEMPDRPEEAQEWIAAANTDMITSSRPGKKYGYQYRKEPTADEKGKPDQVGWSLDQHLDAGTVTTNRKEYRPHAPGGTTPEYAPEPGKPVTAKNKATTKSHIIPYHKDLPNATKKITISTSEQIYDYNTGTWLTPKAGLFEFNAGSLIVDDLGDGVYRAYVQGSSVADPNKEDSDPTTDALGAVKDDKKSKRQTEKDYRVAVPLHIARNVAGIKEDLGWVREALTALQAEGKAVDFGNIQKTNVNWNN